MLPAVHRSNQLCLCSSGPKHQGTVNFWLMWQMACSYHLPTPHHPKMKLFTCSYQRLRVYMKQLGWGRTVRSWSSSTLTTWSEELTHWRRPWCWERWRAREGDNRGWDCWMASPTQRTWIWANARKCWRTGKPGVHGVTQLDTIVRLNSVRRNL